MPFALVTAVPVPPYGLAGDIVKVTVAPTRGTPVAVSVSVAVRVSGVAVPAVVGFGVGGASNSVVGVLTKFTVAVWVIVTELVVSVAV